VRTAQFFSEIPLPGTKSRQRLLEDHCILETVGENIVDFSKYTGSYVIASKTPYETQRNIRDANRRFYSRKVIFKSFLKATFVNGDYKTFGFRAGMGIISRLQNKFIPALKDYSENLRKKEYTVLSPYISKLKENYLSPLIEKKDKLIQTLKEKKDLYTKH